MVILAELILSIIFLFAPFIYFAWYANSVDPRKTKKNKKNYFLDYWKNAFNFKGKTKRKDFWITQVILFFLFIYLTILISNLAVVNECIAQDKYFGLWMNCDKSVFNTFWYLQKINNLLLPYSIIFLIPSISLQIRRLRDAAKNPLWFLICFVPFIGGIVLLIFYLSPSRKKRLPMTLQDRLSEVEDLLTKGTIDEEEYKYMRKQILSKHID